MSTLLLLNKPFRVLCQFTDDTGKSTLADFIEHPAVYPAGRLDYDSEGLVALTDNGRWQARISRPGSAFGKRYWVQVEGEPCDNAIERLRTGITLKDGPARALSARVMTPPPGLWARTPPVRVRKTVPDHWIEITLNEGRNRQVRRMTAHVGLPTLRLIRAGIGPFGLDGLLPGQWRRVAPSDVASALRSL